MGPPARRRLKNQFSFLFSTPTKSTASRILMIRSIMPIFTSSVHFKRRRRRRSNKTSTNNTKLFVADCSETNIGCIASEDVSLLDIAAVSFQGFRAAQLLIPRISAKYTQLVFMAEVQKCAFDKIAFHDRILNFWHEDTVMHCVIGFVKRKPTQRHNVAEFAPKKKKLILWRKHTLLWIRSTGMVWHSLCQPAMLDPVTETRRGTASRHPLLVVST